MSLFLQPNYNSEPVKTPGGTIMASDGREPNPPHLDVRQQRGHFMDVNSSGISYWSRILKATVKTFG